MYFTVYYLPNNAFFLAEEITVFKIKVLIYNSFFIIYLLILFFFFFF